ncbi:RagB/SusD family nutrient uptake outer membrane protein, partial [termite gut metagenome]
MNNYNKIKRLEKAAIQWFIGFFTFMAVAILPSCSDFLNIDRYFDDELKLDSVFSNKRYVESYMWGAAALFPDEGNFYCDNYTPGPIATDESFCTYTNEQFNGMAFVQGLITPDKYNQINTWGNMYKIIRKCNTILSRIDEAEDLLPSERLRILSYTRFIRAYAYYEILVDFGPPVLLSDNVLETNEVIEYYDRPRSTYDEAVEYICNELEEASVYIPEKVSLISFGRPTKGAAYGLIARLRLLHASPLYNGGQAARTYFGNWKRKTDGAYYVSQTPDEKRWAIAAAAAKRVMDMDDAGAPMYKLYTVLADNKTPALPAGVSDLDYYNDFPNGAAGIDPYRSYSEIFNGEAIASANPELVWGRMSAAINTMQKSYFPVLIGGWNRVCVTQKVVDAYRMRDGGTIEEPGPIYTYSENGFTSNIPTFSGYRFINGEVFNMYVNREARFYASIGFSECFWPCSSATTANDYNVTVTYYYDSSNGKSGATNPVDYPITGYVIKKYVNPVDAWSGTNARRMDKAFPIIRYAEILLSYAEALNNLTGSHTVTLGEHTQTLIRDEAEIKKAFNQVRYRVGWPGLSAEELGNPQTVQ